MFSRISCDQIIQQTCVSFSWLGFRKENHSSEGRGYFQKFNYSTVSASVFEISRSIENSPPYLLVQFRQVGPPKVRFKVTEFSPFFVSLDRKFAEKIYQIPGSQPASTSHAWFLFFDSITHRLFRRTRENVHCDIIIFIVFLLTITPI